MPTTNPAFLMNVRAYFTILVVVGYYCSPLVAQEKIDFRQQVRPILSDKCFHCHGPDADNQDSDFRADTKANLFQDLGGYFAVVAGDLQNSELHARIHSADSDQMPPADSNRFLSDEEKEILDQWIAQGAPYQAGHWAFDKIVPPSVPEVPNDFKGWHQNPIDAFIAHRLVAKKLTPATAATPEQQLRRVSLTLTGLLPPPQMRNEFLATPTDDAYRRSVDRLLDSMSYAERQSLRWLDAARYADTDGYQNDNPRTNWPWRDWVIQAYYENMPFDQFTIEQIAGDMLPEATWSQRLGSAFNRNHRQNAEGGALADEFLVENIIDRVETTSAVWLGLTVGCARCHDHKYDPVSQKEFFQLFAYFNNIGEKGIGAGVKANPVMSAVSPLLPMAKQLEAALHAAEMNRDAIAKTTDSRLQDWLLTANDELSALQPVEWTPVSIKGTVVKGTGSLISTDIPYALQFSGQSNSDLTYLVKLMDLPAGTTAIRLEALPRGSPDSKASAGVLNPPAASAEDDFLMSSLDVINNGRRVELEHISATYSSPKHAVEKLIDNNPKSTWGALAGNGKPATVSVTAFPSLAMDLKKKVEVRMTFSNDDQYRSIDRFRIYATTMPGVAIRKTTALESIKPIVEKLAKERTAGDRKKLSHHYKSIDGLFCAAATVAKAAQSKLNSVCGQRVKVMIMSEKSGDPTPAYLLNRGQYDDPDQSAVLPRAVPAVLMADDTIEQPTNRLELARWLVSENNPLTARVIVNRIWQEHFGIGLVKTAEDFGVQGEYPSHPELLDWLAAEFVSSGWDVKHMHRLIVTSAAFRQASHTNATLQELDPHNRLLSRGPRYRADGFTIRDIALQASGLLVAKPGGPPVKPYQPAGLWQSMAASANLRYQAGKGEDLYRKSMYTYWKRAVNPPRQTIFDAGGREVCSVQSRRTNTPLQALVLMNDPAMIEAARKLAERSLTLPGSDAERIGQMYRWAIARDAVPATMKVLQGNLNFFVDHFAKNKDEAKRLLQVGDSARDESIPVARHAAMTAVAHLILNLDEFLTIE